MDGIYQPNTTQTYNMTAGLHVSTITESSSDPNDTDPYKECTMPYGILNAHNICSESHNAWYILCMDLYHEGLKMTQ